MNLWAYWHEPYLWDLDRPTSIPNLLWVHLTISATSLFFGFVIAVPLAVLALRFNRLYLPLIALAGVVYTLPSIAVLAELVPITGLTTLTVLIPLVAYDQVVLIRNIVAAVRAVDPTLVEVGRAMGMNEWQVQRRVVVPLALPIIVAGLRVAAVTTIGIATIAPAVGVQDLGYLIFQGFNPYYPEQILTGALAATLLALAVDLTLLAVQRLLSRGRSIGALA